MLVCPKCGFDNQLGRIFCHQCGNKLDLEQIKPASRGGKTLHQRKPFNGGRIAWLAVRLGVLALLLWSLYLLAQVPEVRKLATTNADLVSFYRKRDQLSGLVDEKKPAKTAITEGELNAFIDTLGFEEAKGTGLKVVPSNLQIELGDGVVKVIIVGKVKVGASWEKQLGISCTGMPGIESGAFVFKPVAAAIGKLPIHPLILEHTELIQSYFLQLFRNLSEEHKLLDRLSTVAVDRNHLSLSYQPPAPAH